MLTKVKSGKVSYKLADTADKAKTLVTVGGLSEASAEGTVPFFCTLLVQLAVHVIVMYTNVGVPSYDGGFFLTEFRHVPTLALVLFVVIKLHTCIDMCYLT